MSTQERTISPSGLFNVFDPDLKRGSASLPYAPKKRYMYVEHPVEGWRVYLRSVCFLHEESVPDPQRFLVVKRTGSSPEARSWEPPKGQMEAKDSSSKQKKVALIELLADNILREVAEEAKLTSLSSLRYTGLVVQSREPDYPPNTYFQYHIFQATVPSEAIQTAKNQFQWFQEHPASFKKLRADEKEKDDLAWFDPKTTRLMGKWSPSIVALYLQNAPHLGSFK